MILDLFNFESCTYICTSGGSSGGGGDPGDSLPRFQNLAQLTPNLLICSFKTAVFSNNNNFPPLDLSLLSSPPTGAPGTATGLSQGSLQICVFNT